MGELFLLFLKLGTLGFGGPPAHLEMIRRECVERREWLHEEELLDIIGAANLVPGPNSTEVALHIGYRRAGFNGMLLAGAGFILPAVLITALLAAGYVRYGDLPWARSFAFGLRPAVIAIIVVSAIRLGRPAIKSPLLALCALVALAASRVGVPEALVLLAVGGMAAIAPVRPPALMVSPLPLFLFFLQVGSTIYGGGFVLASYLQSGLAEQLHWMSPSAVTDAIAIGQVTPGPVFSTATFVGYVLGGPSGAGAATLGIFLPSFLFVPFLGRAADWARSRPAFGRFLDGVNAASFALMASVALKLAPNAITTPAQGVLAAGVVWAGLASRANPGLLVLGGGLVAMLTATR